MLDYVRIPQSNPFTILRVYQNLELFRTSSSARTAVDLCALTTAALRPDPAVLQINPGQVKTMT